MIPGLGSPLEIGLAVAIYMIALWLVTEYIKPLLKLKPGAAASDRKALGLSWAVGLALFGLLSLSGCYAVTWASMILFVIVTGLCNSAYRWTRLKELLHSIIGG